MVNAKAPPVPEMDTSIENWILNTRSVLNFPITVISVLSLLVAGTFAEVAPRKSLEFMDNTFGTVFFFVAPLLVCLFLGWPTGLLAAVVSLIVFIRLQKEDLDEGFVDSPETKTTIVSNPHRWFVEKILGERPVAISSDRVITQAVEEDNRTSSAGSPGTSSRGTSSSNTTSTSSIPSAASLLEQFNSSSSNK